MTQGITLPEVTTGAMSPDGNFYWDGAQWISVLSPDGYWLWNGATWVPRESVSARSILHPYISPAGLAIGANTLLVITSAVTVVEALIVSDFVTFDAWLNNIRVSYTISPFGLIVFTLTAAVFLGWFHRSHRNLAALGARDLQYSSASAVGWWFVPVAGLWKPYRAAHEIWRAGDPAEVGPSQLIKIWWAAWLVSLFLFNVAAFAPSANNVISWQGALSAQATVLAAVLAILVVRSVSARQDQRWRDLCAIQGTAP